MVVRVIGLRLEAERRHAFHFERRGVRPARARRMGPGHAPLELERPLRIERGQGRADLLEIGQPGLGHHGAGDGAGAAVPVDHHDDLGGDAGAVLQPVLRADQPDLLGREEDDGDRPFGPPAGRLDQAQGFHGRGETRPVVDGASRGAEAVEMPSEDDVFVGEFGAAEGRDDAVVLDRPHLEPVPDVELELDRLALLDQALDLFPLAFGQLDIGQHRKLVPGCDVPVQHPERVGLGRLDRAAGPGLDERRGQGGNELRVGVLGRAAPAVAGKTGVRRRG